VVARASGAESSRHYLSWLPGSPFGQPEPKISHSVRFRGVTRPRLGFRCRGPAQLSGELPLLLGRNLGDRLVLG
jgi:hypothetical protein